jgi:hypothetical protein
MSLIFQTRCALRIRFRLSSLHACFMRFNFSVPSYENCPKVLVERSVIRGRPLFGLRMVVGSD